MHPQVSLIQKRNIPQNMITSTFPIGFHIKKEQSLYQSLLPYLDKQIPLQIFLGNPMTKTCELKPDDITKTHMLITQANISLFIHAPYVINLSSGSQPCLRKILEYGSQLGAKGVVVHVGKACHDRPEVALDQMTTHLQEILPFSTETCPLLLETPAGQGTELLAGQMEQFNEYCSGFGPGLGICIDTCHVFAAGIQPFDYVSGTLTHPTWNQMVKLIHLNDSVKPFGSRVDRHAVLGGGEIGMTDLLNIAQMATDAGIPMVNE